MCSCQGRLSENRTKNWSYNNNDYYTEESIQRSTLIADTTMQTANIYTEKLLKEINKQSRNLCSKLYNPLLYTKNYSVWKNSVEQLVCLFITEHYNVSKTSVFSMGKGEEEYKKLRLNYDETLAKYSTFYKIWKKLPLNKEDCTKFISLSRKRKGI